MGNQELIKKISEQKRLYKDGTKSLCKGCFNYNEDCFEAFKLCETDSKTKCSTVTKCGNLNKKLGQNEYKGTSISAQSAESRMDMMGGGFHLVEKYRKDNDEDNKK